MRDVASLSELPVSARLFLKAYPWRRIDPVPWSPLARPLRESRVALVSTAGLVLPEQEPFEDDVRGGDCSYREIPFDADAKSLIDSHRSGSYDHGGVHADPNLGLPLDRIRELATEGAIGSVNRRHFSLMGSITAPGRLTTDSAKVVADSLAADGVGAVLLVPI